MVSSNKALNSLVDFELSELVINDLIWTRGGISVRNLRDYWRWVHWRISGGFIDRFASLKTLIENRDCLLVASAPEPTIPKNISKDVPIICVNSSGWTAKNSGLRQPDLTFLSCFKLFVTERASDRKALIGLTTNNLIMFTEHYDRRAYSSAYDIILKIFKYRFSQKFYLSYKDRGKIVKQIIKKDMGFGDRDQNKISHGVFTAALLFFLGAKSITFSGFSLNENGHAYSDQNRRRYHKAPDRLALQKLLDQGYALKTTEVPLSEELLIQLVDNI